MLSTRATSLATAPEVPPRVLAPTRSLVMRRVFPALRMAPAVWLVVPTRHVDFPEITCYA